MENKEIIITHGAAETIHIDHPEASYGIFCFNTQGDLFLNSDWGSFIYAWRAFGSDFKLFISGTNAQYIVGKFAINYLEMSRKKLPKHIEKNLLILVQCLIDYLNKEV